MTSEIKIIPAENRRFNTAREAFHTTAFEKAVAAIVTGDAKELEAILRETPAIINECIRDRLEATTGADKDKLKRLLETEPQDTLLMIATKSAHPARVGMVRVLLRNGADPNLQDRWGNTALHMAAKARDEGVIAELFPKTRQNLTNTFGHVPVESILSSGMTADEMERAGVLGEVNRYAAAKEMPERKPTFTKYAEKNKQGPER